MSFKILKCHRIDETIVSLHTFVLDLTFMCCKHKISTLFTGVVLYVLHDFLKRWINLFYPTSLYFKCIFKDRTKTEREKMRREHTRESWNFSLDIHIANVFLMCLNGIHCRFRPCRHTSPSYRQINLLEFFKNLTRKGDCQLVCRSFGGLRRPAI